MYVTVLVLQGNKRILPWKMCLCSEEHTLYFHPFFHPFFYTNESLCFFQVLKKKINAKMFNTICIVFLGGGCGEIV